MDYKVYIGVFIGIMEKGIVLNYCQYGVLYLGSYDNTGPYINFLQLGNSNLGKLPGEYSACYWVGKPYVWGLTEAASQNGTSPSPPIPQSVLYIFWTHSFDPLTLNPKP